MRCMGVGQPESILELMARGISLANKCQIIFGVAVVIILAAALALPWMRVQAVVDESQLEVSRQLAQTWVADGFALHRSDGIPIPMRVVTVDELESHPESDPFVAAAFADFSADSAKMELYEVAQSGGVTVYHYARALREREWRAIQDRSFVDFSPRVSEPSIDDALRALLVIERTSETAAHQVAMNRMGIVISAAASVLLAVLVFHFVLTKLIFSPVRRLRAAAERVGRGDLSARSRLVTGDDFEELSRAFDGMLEELAGSQTQLRAMNRNLDLKLVELAEANLGLFESNRLKSEFLANVSHELRTPLNSIIGFAELLEEIARNDAAADPKRIRYIVNILTSGRMLLDMINELLDMAKIEAGRMEVVVAYSSIKDVVEGIGGIMRPQAMAKRIEIALEVAPDLPPLETDAGKLQQILHNFLSNAIKFSPEGSVVRMQGLLVRRSGAPDHVRLAVVDRGVGVPYDMQETIFDKFRQVDASHTRKHSGTGLGLAICRELAEMLGGTLSLVSIPGSGATFAVELPVTFRPRDLPPLVAPSRAVPSAPPI